MLRCRNCLWIVGLLALALPGWARADELPKEAQAIVDSYQEAATAVRAKADAQVAALAAQQVPKLKSLQDSYCRAAKLDEALAIRNAIRELLGIKPDPGQLSASAQDIGRTFLYEVVGATDGTVWGSEVYTSDSGLAAAAVHAGVLKLGEKGIVRVRIVPGQASYSGSTRNGVTSKPWGAWGVSFTIERAKSLPVD